MNDFNFEAELLKRIKSVERAQKATQRALNLAAPGIAYSELSHALINLRIARLATARDIQVLLSKDGNK